MSLRSTPASAGPLPGTDSAVDFAVDSAADSGASLMADPDTGAALQLVAEGITQLVGFDVAAVSLVRDAQHLQVLAVAGSEAARRTLFGTTMPLELLMAELDQADDWGRFKFVPQDRRSPESTEWGWVPELDHSDDPTAWQPLDLLVAPLRDDHGVLRGLLSIDCPSDGKRPDLPHRRVLERYAAQAARAMGLAVEREQLAEQVRLLSAARAIVRSVADASGITGQLDQVQTSLRDCFRASGMWAHIFEAPDNAFSYTIDGETQQLSRSLVQTIEGISVDSWTAQQVAFLGSRADDARQLPPTSEVEVAEMVAFMRAVGIGTVLMAPMGAGPECLGTIVLTRSLAGPEWTEQEMDTALEIGRDIGRAILNGRAVERERNAVRELRALDDYKSGLITTLSHELKSPLAAMLGNLELLEDRQRALAADPELEVVLSAVGRGAARLVRVVENLLLLAQVEDPHRPPEVQRVDLAHVVGEVRALTPLAAQDRLVLRVEGPGPVYALGDPSELESLVGNLVGNAMKYADPASPVTVTLRREGDEAVLECADEGIGIAPADRERLFEEFFRSEDTQVRQQAGTGLGLAIVERIVARHSGRIDVASELGVGTVVQVTLPAAD